MREEARVDRLARLAALVGLLVFVAGLALAPMAESDLFFRIEAGRRDPRAPRAARREPLLVHVPRPSRPRHVVALRGGRGGAARARRLPGARARQDGRARRDVRGRVRACACRRGAGPAASALALAAAAFVGRDRFVERPHVFSLAGVVARRSRSPRRSRHGPRSATRGVRAASSSPRSRASCCGPTCTRACSSRPCCSRSRRVGARLDGGPGARRLGGLAVGRGARDARDARRRGAS